ncbi:MAG: glycosyltransferase [Alphaproteobacteria bacterium]|nr:glycosyltransferase [Alphaproteobacteria bacterium]
MKNKKISVLVPAYNAERILHETFDSLLQQTYTNWECLCIDDGSKDNTYDVMQRYAKQDKRFRIFQQKNTGITGANNALLNQVDNQTTYIYFLDSDDYIHPQTFEILVGIQQRTQADAVEGECSRFQDKKPDDYFQHIDVDSLNVTVLTDLSVYLLKRTRKHLSGMWINKCKLYVWDKVKNMRFHEKLSYEDDYFYNSQVHTVMSSKAIVNYPFYYYRINSSSMTRSVNYQRYQDACTVRIYATYDYFIKGKRVPDNILTEFRKDLAEDAYRMIGLKPVRRCPDKVLRKQLFHKACLVFSDMRLSGVLDTALLSRYQRLVLWAFRCHLYWLTRFLILFK